jgi:hypothetical protein
MPVPLEQQPCWNELHAQVRRRSPRDLARQYGVSLGELLAALERVRNGARTPGAAASKAAVPRAIYRVEAVRAGAARTHALFAADAAAAAIAATSRLGGQWTVTSAVRLGEPLD